MRSMLHIQTLSAVSETMKDSLDSLQGVTHVSKTVSWGIPAAHGLKFKKGGLHRQLHAYVEEKREQSEQFMEVLARCRSMNGDTELNDEAKMKLEHFTVPAVVSFFFC